MLCNWLIITQASGIGCHTFALLQTSQLTPIWRAETTTSSS